MSFKKLITFGGIFAQKKAEQGGRALTEMMATWDPETASEAEIEMMIKSLEDVTGNVAKARADYNREKAEADAAEKEYATLLATAEKIQSAMEGASPEEMPELEEALGEIVTTLEEKKPEVEREMEEAEDAKLIMNELEEMAKVAAEKVKTAKDTLAKARRNMQKAQVRAERAEQREESAKKLAGLKSNMDEMGSALSAFDRAADKANQKAEASELRSSLLKPTESKSSSVIDKFRTEVEGTGKPTNIGDRLAALKK